MTLTVEQLQPITTVLNNRAHILLAGARGSHRAVARTVRAYRI